MSFNKSKIEILFTNGERTTIPCFSILSPFIVNKMRRQQGDDIKTMTVHPISNDEYKQLLRLQDSPKERITNEELFHTHFWNAT